MRYIHAIAESYLPSVRYLEDETASINLAITAQ